MNGAIERFSGFIIQSARAMIIDSGLPEYLWPLAVDSAVHIANRLVRTGEDDLEQDPRPPAQIWRDDLGISAPEVTVNHLRVWGCPAYVHIPKEDRVKARKMAPFAKKGYFVGYAGNHIYKVWYPDSGKIVRSSHVNFNEDGDGDDNQPIAGSSPRGPTPNTDGGDDAVVPFRYNVRPESPEEPITGRVHTITPDAELLAPAPSTIHRTIENRSPQTIQQLTAQQNPREQDVETIRQSIERFSLPPFAGYRESENLYDSDSDRDSTTRHSVVRFAPKDQLIPSSPDALTPPNIPSTPTVYRSTDVPEAPRATSVVNRTAEPPKKGPLLAIKPRLFGGFIDDDGRQHVTRHIEPTTRSNEIMRQATVRHEYAVAGIDQSEAAPTKHTEHRRSNRDSKGQWHSKRFDEEQAEQLQNEERRRLEKRENRAQKREGTLHLPPIPETPRPVPGQYPRTPTPQDTVDSADLICSALQLKTWQVPIPTSYTEALKSPHAEQWKEAMQIQYDKLVSNNTWQLVDRPRAENSEEVIKVLHGKWVYDLKSDSQNNVLAFRGRWVICGNQQRPGYDFDQVYAPVAVEVTVKLFFAMVVKKRLQWCQFDIITAYLNALMDSHKILMVQPIGFKQQDKVCLLNKALYGLRQAGYLWNITFNKELQELGIYPVHEDPCLYVDYQRDIYVVIHVDDALVAAPDGATINAFIESVRAHFGVKMIGEPVRFLGCDIVRDYDANTIKISQHAYTNDLVAKLNMQNANSTNLPMVKGWNADDSVDILSPKDMHDHQVILGKLNWLSTKTRPDITLALNKLQQRQAIAKSSDLAVAKRMIRYLVGTPAYGLTFCSSDSPSLVGFVDASHADAKDRKSTGSFVFFYGTTPISWQSKVQTIVAPSTLIAEFIAFSEATKEALWLKKLATSLKLIDQNDPIVIYTDSMNTIANLSKDGYSSKTKWLDIKYFFGREAVRNGYINPKHVASGENVADGLTKALDEEKFKHFVELLGLGPDRILPT